MNKCIVFVDDDERFLEQSREHLTYRGYEFIGWRDSRMAFDAIMRQKDRIVAFLKVRHLAVRPLERLASAAAFRMNRGSSDPFRLKTRVGELVSLVAIFNRLFGSQDERVAELVALIHAFGHDANRYANHVSGAAYLCLDPVVPFERQKEHLAELPALAVWEIAAFQDHLVQTVGIVDNYNRIKGPPFAAVDVVSVAKGCLARLRPEADAKHLALSAAHPSSCVILAHEQKLANVIDNLVGNAIKFTPEGGRITLSVGGQKGALVIAVTDTGCGIAADCRERVFDPGFRGTAAVEGHGLGLSFVRSVIPRSDRKRVYALLSFIPAVLFYLVLLTYM